MTVAWQPLWPALALVVVTLIALVLRGVSLTALRRWAAAPSSWTSVAEAIRTPALLWCAVAGLYVANEVARDASLLPTRWHERLGLPLEIAVILSVTITLAGLAGRTISQVSDRQALGGTVTGLAHTATRGSGIDRWGAGASVLGGRADYAHPYLPGRSRPTEVGLLERRKRTRWRRAG